MKKTAILMAILSLANATSCFAKEVTVKAYVDAPEATCREGATSKSKVIVTLKKGDKLEVKMESAQDKYVKSQCGRQSGYIRKYDLYLFRPGQIPKTWERGEAVTAQCPASVGNGLSDRLS